MPAQLVKIINVRVDAAVARAIKKRVAAEGGTLSDFARSCLMSEIGTSRVVSESPIHRRERAATLATLTGLSTDLKKMGGLYAYALKAGTPVSDNEERMRIDALEAIRDAARRLHPP